MTNAPAPLSVAQAQARSRDARQRLLTTMGEVKTKLNPKTLVQDTAGNVANNVVRDTVETVRARPGAVAAAVGLTALFLGRKPVARLLKRGTTNLSATLRGRSSRKKGSDL